MMDLNQTYENIKGSSEFKTFIRENPNYYLVHIFKKLDKKSDLEWQFGYYSKEDDRIVSFIINKKGIEKTAPSEVFKKPDETIYELDLNKVKENWREALVKADKKLKEISSQDLPAMVFFILQKIKGFEEIYNITILTQRFNTFNIKISAIDGGILSHKLSSVMDLGSVEKGSIDK